MPCDTRANIRCSFVFLPDKQETDAGRQSQAHRKAHQVLTEDVAVVKHAEAQGAAGSVEHPEKEVPGAPREHARLRKIPFERRERRGDVVPKERRSEKSGCAGNVPLVQIYCLGYICCTS